MSSQQGYGNAGAHKAIGHMHYGIYYAQGGTVGGKTLYFSEDGRSSLWYTQRAWRISWKESYGGTACNAYVTSESNCPDQSFNWRFHSYDLNSWYDAGKSLGIWYRS